MPSLSEDITSSALSAHQAEVEVPQTKAAHDIMASKSAAFKTKDALSAKPSKSKVPDLFDEDEDDDEDLFAVVKPKAASKVSCV